MKLRKNMGMEMSIGVIVTIIVAVIIAVAVAVMLMRGTGGISATVKSAIGSLSTWIMG